MIKIVIGIINFMKKAKKDRVSAYAAQSSFFIIVSFFPFIMLLMTILQYTAVPQETLLSMTKAVFPDSIHYTVEQIVGEMYSNISTAVLSITIVSTLLAACKGFVALIEGLNSVFGIDETRNYFVLRLSAIFYTVIMIITIALSLIILVFGNKLLDFVSGYAPLAGEIINSVLRVKSLLSISLFTILFTCMYVIIPNRHTTFRRQIPGALFASVGWILFSYFFSLYVNYTDKYSIIYGSLSALVFIMLWLYVCMTLFLYGAEVNLALEKRFALKRMRDKKNISIHS